MSSSQVTGPFHPPHSGQQIKAGGLAVLGTEIFYFETKSDNTIWVTNGDLTQQSNITASAAWNQYQLQLNNGNSGTFTPATAQRSAAVTLTTSSSGMPLSTLYFFWLDLNNHNNVYAASTTSTAGPWGQKLEIYADTAGTNHLQVSGSGISVTAFGGKLILSWLDSNASHAYWMWLDPADIHYNSSKGRWVWLPQQSAVNISASAINSNLSTLGTDVTNAWFTQSGGNNYMVSAFYGITGKNINSHQTLLLLSAMDSNGLPNNTLKSQSITAYNKSVCLQRDTAGQIRLYYADSNNVLQVSTLATDSLDMDISGPNPLNGSSVTIQDSPSATFALGTPTVDPSNDLRTTCDAYEIVMYGDETKQDSDNSSEVDLTCQIAYYGQLETIEAIETLDYYQYARQPWAPLLMIDGPFPVPAYAAQSMGSNGIVATVMYNVSNTQASGHTVEGSLAAGVKTSGEAVVGVGVAWDISLTAGVTGTMSSSHRRDLEESRSSYTSVENGQVSDLAIAFVNNLTWVRNESHMLDLNGHVVQTAPINSTIAVLPTNRSQITFPTYSATPGDLTSYTSTKINETMNTLFPADCTYRNAWGDWGTDYVKNVIEANAQPLTSSKNYLEFVVGPGGITSEAFTDITTTFQEFGWTLDASVWVGVAAEFEVEETKFFGFDAKLSAQGLVGVDFSVKTADSSEQEQDWGIRVEILPDLTQHLTHSYTVRLYLLKSSPRWVDEAIQAAAAKGYSSTDLGLLDIYASPLKIAFVVTET